MPTPLQLDINYVVYNILEIIETKQNIPILKNFKEGSKNNTCNAILLLIYLHDHRKFC